jgi:hypothetical protein
VAGQPETPVPVRNKRLTWTFGDLRFEYFQGPQKINISHKNTGATATIKLDQNDCVGDDVVFTAQVEEETKKYEAKDWGLTICFAGNNQVRFEFATDGFNMSLDVS